MAKSYNKVELQEGQKVYQINAGLDNLPSLQEFTVSRIIDPLNVEITSNIMCGSIKSDTTRIEKSNNLHTSPQELIALWLQNYEKQIAQIKNLAERLRGQLKNNFGTDIIEHESTI